MNISVERLCILLWLVGMLILAIYTYRNNRGEVGILFELGPSTAFVGWLTMLAFTCLSWIVVLPMWIVRLFGYGMEIKITLR